MLGKPDKIQIMLAAGFSLLLLAGSTATIPVHAGAVQPFFTPSVEPVEMHATPPAFAPADPGTFHKGADKIAEPVPLPETGHLLPGQIFSSAQDLPLTAHKGLNEFGIAAVRGRTDLLALWITRNGDTSWLLVSADNPSLYGIRDPVTDAPLGLGFLQRLEDWQELRQRRVEIMAESAGGVSSLIGAGASAAGGLLTGSPGQTVAGLLAAVDIAGGALERYVEGGFIYVTMVDVQRDLLNLYDEAIEYETQTQGGS